MTTCRDLDIQTEVLAALDEVLSLRGRSASFDATTRLMGSLPEFDSMAVVSLITALEERFGFSVEDDEISGDIFETVGSLSAYVSAKLVA